MVGEFVSGRITVAGEYAMLIGEYIPSDRIYLYWTRKHRAARGEGVPFAPRAVHFIAG